MKWLRYILAMAALLVMTSAGAASGQALSDYALYGVDGATEELYRYGFADEAGSPVGLIRDAETGATMAGIKALAYVPGHQNIFAFWTDPADNKTKLAYVNLSDATARIYPTDFGTGPITAATAVKDTAGTSLTTLQPTPIAERAGHKIYAVQHYLTISGRININPNNSTDNEFVLTKPNGAGQITRDDLHNNTVVDRSSGTFYYGPATSVHVKPKGSGSQNTLILNGTPYNVDNSNTYYIHGQYMTCRVYNDQVNGAGKAMGKWWIEISTGSVVVEDWGVSGTTQQSSSTGLSLFGTILRVDPTTGVAQQVMKISRFYDGLAGQVGTTLYAVSSGRIYVIDTVAGTETALSNILGYTNVEALENAGSRLYGFTTLDKRLLPISNFNGSLSATPINIGDVKLRSKVFMRLADEPRGADFD